MASSKVSLRPLSLEEIRELLCPDSECTVCHRITGHSGQWCPYCGGEVRHLGRVYEE